MRKFGIDISEWQPSGKIDYDALAESIDFAIIRAGGTFRKEWDFYHDRFFSDHYLELTARGIPLGAYWYSTASTAAEGREEAAEMLDVIGSKTFDYPLVIDVEEERCTTDGVVAFCEHIEQAGHYVAIYANENYLYNRLDCSRLAPYDIWLASWTDSPSSPLPYGMWQYTSDGSLDGYDGRLDLDYAYKDYPALIKAMRGEAPAPAPQPTEVEDRAESAATSETTYTVESGDTLSGIAERYGTTYQALAEYNRIDNPNLIYPGDVIRIHGTRAEAESPAATPSTRYYTVESGDSWWGIADSELGDGSRMHELAEANGVTIEQMLYPGDVLKLPN